MTEQTNVANGLTNCILLIQMHISTKIHTGVSFPPTVIKQKQKQHWPLGQISLKFKSWLSHLGKIT